jgi:hypothetical protein
MVKSTSFNAAINQSSPPEPGTSGPSRLRYTSPQEPSLELPALWRPVTRHHTLEMAPPSALSTEDKAKVKKTLSTNNKILTATVARVYEARQGETRYVPGCAGCRGISLWLSCRWRYTGIQGCVAFCSDKNVGGLWFRVVDLNVSLRIYGLQQRYTLTSFPSVRDPAE